jgi:hypothetical protein
MKTGYGFTEFENIEEFANYMKKLDYKCIICIYQIIHAGQKIMH